MWTPWQETILLVVIKLTVVFIFNLLCVLFLSLDHTSFIIDLKHRRTPYQKRSKVHMYPVSYITIEENLYGKSNLIDLQNHRRYNY